MIRKRIKLLVLTFSAFPFLYLAAEGSKGDIPGSAGSHLSYEVYGEFNEPWAMAFLPGGKLLITEKSGNLLLFETERREFIPVENLPEVAYGGQGGLGDVILHPQFTRNRQIYLSYAEDGRGGTRGAAVMQATLVERADHVSLEDKRVIWRQSPKVSGNGHYSHRLAIDGEGYLFISSGERQKQDPAQSWTQDLGKIIRLHDDGRVPMDNPFQDRGDLARSFWTLGHRNILGMAFDSQGRLWAHEMGPRHGDEFNLILPGENYGWPLVSWGNQYSGVDIPDHDTRPDFYAPQVYWIPSVAPSGLIIYGGDLFSEWKDQAILGGLVSQSLVRVQIKGENAREVERFDMGKRIREVEEGPDGVIWVLEDRAGGRLLRLTPANE